MFPAAVDKVFFPYFTTIALFKFSSHTYKRGSHDSFDIQNHYQLWEVFVYTRH